MLADTPATSDALVSLAAMPDVAQLLDLVLTRLNPAIPVTGIGLSAAFVVCDLSQLDAPIVYCSPAFEALTGYTFLQIVGTNCRFLQHPSGQVAANSPRHYVDRSSVHRFKAAITDRQEYQETILNYRRGGHPFLNLLTILPVPTSGRGSSPLYSLGLSLDLVQYPDAVTQKTVKGDYVVDYGRLPLPTRPEQTVDPPLSDPWLVLRSGDPGFDCLQHCTSLVLILSTRMHILHASPSSRQLLGFEPNELLGAPVSAFCHPSDVVGLFRAVKPDKAGESVEYLLRMRCAEGGFIWVDLAGSLVNNDGGQGSFISLMGREYHIASRVDLSQHSRDSEGIMYGAYARASALGIILRVSSSSRAVLGKSSNELQGSQIQERLHQESVARFDSDVATAIESGATLTGFYLVKGQQDRRLAAHFTIQPENSSRNSSGDASASVLELQIVLARGFGVGKTGAELAALTKFTEREGRTVPFQELEAARGSAWTEEVFKLKQENKQLASQLEAMLRGQKRRRRRQLHETNRAHLRCQMCNTTESPEWRRGPTGAQQLCNACGLKWMKKVKETPEDADALDAGSSGGQQCRR